MAENISTYCRNCRRIICECKAPILVTKGAAVFCLMPDKPHYELIQVMPDIEQCTDFISSNKKEGAKYYISPGIIVE